MDSKVYKSEHGKNKIRMLVSDIYNSFEDYQCTTLKVNTSIGETHVIRFGNTGKPALLMLHGTMSNSATWFSSVKYFINDFCIYLVDIPGEPGLSAPFRIVLNSEIPGTWLLEVFDNLKISKASIISMSLGSWYTLNFASLYPDRISSISLLTTSGVVPAKVSFIFKALFFMMLGKTGQKLINKALFYKTPQVNDSNFIKYQQHVNTYFKPVVEPIPILSDNMIKKINFPVQYFGGDHDVILDSLKTAERFKRLLANMEINILKETGHVITDQFENIYRFIKGNRDEN